MRRPRIAHKSRLSITAVAILAALSLPSGASAAPPSGGTPTQAFWDGCFNLETLVDVPKDTIDVPEPFVLPNSTDTMAHLIVSAFRCQSVTVGDVMKPTLLVSVGVQIQTPEDVEPVGPVEVHEYLLFAFTNNSTFARWLKQGTGLETTYVPGIDYFYPIGDLGTGDFRVHVPSPSPSITLHGTATAQKQVPVFLSGSWWRKTDKQIVRFAAPPFAHYFAFVPGDQVTITADGELAELMDTPRTCTATGTTLPACLFDPHHDGLITQTKYTCPVDDISACGPSPTAASAHRTSATKA